MLEEVERTFPKRNGTEGVESGLSIRDVSPDGPRLQNNLTYIWGKGEKDRFKGKLRDRFIVVALTKQTPNFGGVISCEGVIVSVEGPPVDGNGSIGKSK